METIHGIPDLEASIETVLTIGTFDGVHVGHGRILQKVVACAKKEGLKSVLFTFFPHPRLVLQKDATIKLLNTLEEKIKILETTGLDYLIVYPFTKEFSRLSAVDFVRDLLVNSLNAKRVIIGYDHRFGRNRDANIQDLRSFGRTFDFEVDEIPAQDIDEVTVSSTKIRKAISEGKIQTANTYLGYAYPLTGEIVKGKGLGRQLGYPTANLSLESADKLIPKNGVYVVQANLSKTTVYGVMNIGINPTVSGENKTIEIHFIDFSKDLYGEQIQVQLLSRIRDEHKFDSVDSLKEQIGKDKAMALEMIK